MQPRGYCINLSALLRAVYTLSTLVLSQVSQLQSFFTRQSQPESVSYRTRTMKYPNPEETIKHDMSFGPG